MQTPKIALASDHGGQELKSHILAYLQQKSYNCQDFGSHTAARTDYAPYAALACKAVQSGNCQLALLFCGTGVGMGIAANKHRGIRACCCTDAFSAEMTRRHNNANVLCLGGRVLGLGLAEKLVDIFLSTPFEGGIHQHRIGLIEQIEEEQA